MVEELQKEQARADDSKSAHGRSRALGPSSVHAAAVV
jgi:hypothetical protein